MTKPPPPPPPIPGAGRKAPSTSGGPKGGNGKSEVGAELLDSDLLRLVEEPAPRPTSARQETVQKLKGGRASRSKKARETIMGVGPSPGALAKDAGKSAAAKGRHGSGAKPAEAEEEITPVREHVEIPPEARRSGPKADLLAPIDEGAAKKKRSKDDSSPEALPVQGRRFGRFELLLEMGSGGMATLYLARIRGPQNFEKLIAIKKIHDHLSREEEFVDMFLDEARISAMIHHPNVVQIFDLGSIDGAYFIAMEYIHGQDFAQLLRAVIRTRNETYSWPYAARIVADAAAGLHAAHELVDAEGKPLGLVHRDVSPQNLLVTYDGYAKVVDFGIAYAAEKISHTGVGTLKGKASYMSPEQSRGKPVDRRSDVFALGILLFESTCLKRLFREDSEAATLLRVGEADVPRPRSIRPSLPVELEQIILKALAKDPDDRFATAADLQQALERLLVSRGTVVGPTQVAQLMDELFHDRKRIRDSQIRDVTARPTTNVGAAIGVSTTTVTQLGALDEAESGPARRWLKPLLIGAVAAAAVALAVLLALPYLRGQAEQPVRSAPGPMAPPRRPAVRQVAVPLRPPPRRNEAPEVQKVLLEIHVKPRRARATILFRGKYFQQNDLEILVKPADTPEVVLVEAPGYQSISRAITVNPKVSLKHDFVLRRVVIRRRPARPQRRPMQETDLKLLPSE